MDFVNSRDSGPPVCQTSRLFEFTGPLASGGSSPSCKNGPPDPHGMYSFLYLKVCSDLQRAPSFASRDPSDLRREQNYRFASNEPVDSRDDEFTAERSIPNAYPRVRTLIGFSSVHSPFFESQRQWFCGTSVGDMVILLPHRRLKYRRYL